MDRSSIESSRQSDIEDIVESALYESLTDDKDSEDETACSLLEEAPTNEAESRKDTLAFDYNEEAGFADAGEKEVELNDPEKTESPKDIDNFPRLPMEANCTIEKIMDDDNSNAASSTTVNSGLDSFPTEDVKDVPTRQADASSISTGTTTSSSLFNRSEPLAIPSTSRDSSGLAPASESSPKRPTNFGMNIKQAIHVFHPINPRSILQRLPIPIHSGQWVYLRDSPESSDYGGSPDSLEDPFLMEALDIKIPESEVEDLFTPRNEDMPSCPPPILNPVPNSDSPTDEVEGAVGGLLCAPGHKEKSYEYETPDHTEQKVEKYSSESGHIGGTIEDESLDIVDLPSANDHTERSLENLLSDLDRMQRAIGDILSGSVPNELRHSSRTRKFGSNESGTNAEDIGDPLFESARMQESVEDLHPELDDIKLNINEDMPSCPPPILNPVLNSDSPTDEVKRAVGDLLCAPGHKEKSYEYVTPDHTEQKVGNYSSESGHIGGTVEDESLDIVDLPSANDQTEISLENLPSDLGRMQRAIGDILSGSVPNELRHSSRTRKYGSNESGTNAEDIGDPLFESVRMQESVGDLHPELDDIKLNVKDNPSKSGFTEEIIEDFLPERDSSEDSAIERFDNTHSESNVANISPESSPKADKNAEY